MRERARSNDANLGLSGSTSATIWSTFSGGRSVLYGEVGEVVEQGCRGIALRRVGLDSTEKPREPVHCVGALPWNGRVGADAPHLELHLQPPLLTDTQQVGQAARCVDGGAATLIDREGRGDLVGMVLGEPAEPVAAAMLLVGPGAEDEAVLQLDAVPLQQAHRHHLGGQQPLAVGRSASVDAAVRHLGPEGREAPLGGILHRHHVGMGHEHEPRPGLAALDTSNDVPPLGRPTKDLGGDAVLGQPVADVLAHRCLASGGHEAGVDGGDTDEVALQRDDLRLQGVHLLEQWSEVWQLWSSSGRLA